jgi:maleylacetoacetate isomerase
LARPKLYSFWRSSCSWRVRWALAIKGIDFDVQSIDILHGGQEEPRFKAENPIGYVPALVLEDGRCLAESVAIFDYLEALAPSPALYPKDAWLRARVVQLVSLVATGVQPLQNTNVLDRVGDMAADRHSPSADPSRGEAIVAWAAHYNARGLACYERWLEIIQSETGSKGPYSVGGALSAADIFLVPQVYSARRFKVDVSAFPRVLAAEAAALAEAHAEAARPENQPDAPKK